MRVNEVKPITDQGLAASIRNSNQGVFELVFKFYYSGLVVYADKIVQNIDVSEDIVQSVFMKLWETRETIEIRSFRSYFIQCVKNRCIDHIRNQHVKSKFDHRISETNQFVTDDDLWTKSDLAGLIEESVESLPPRCREIFKMSRYENLKIAEIAGQLHISTRTVETQISKALKILRLKLIDYLSLLFPLFFS
ncbi:MAG TPA: RNA polymerase sigma-70 factor [Prolixibacteraceae bacterium]|nr:RNA polymerase sigma-70 factor [Prolixibacteraceae bacterium]